MNKGNFTKPIRKLGLMHTLDKAKFAYQDIKNKKINQSFLAKYPNVKLPPKYMMFESFQLNYYKYFEGGQDTANWIKNTFSRHTSTFQDKKILDWGCGPARVIRHLPTIIEDECEIYGTDYNKKTIAWCKENIEEIDFRINQINPPLDYTTGFFDMVYGISIFTHLSEVNHQKWFDELIRVTKPGALILITTQGKANQIKLTKEEWESFQKGNLVTRGNVLEGHSVFIAFHPKTYMHQLFADKVEVLEHVEGKIKDWGIEQDMWVIKKR